MGIGRLLAIPAALVMPLLAARWGNMHVVIPEALGFTAGLLSMALVSHWVAASLGFMIVMTAIAIWMPAFTVYSQESIPRHWQAAMSGIINMTIGLGITLAAIGGGYLIPALGYQNTFLLGGALSALGTLIFWAHLRMSSPTTATIGTSRASR